MMSLAISLGAPWSQKQLGRIRSNLGSAPYDPDVPKGFSCDTRVWWITTILDSKTGLMGRSNKVFKSKSHLTLAKNYNHSSQHL